MLLRRCAVVGGKCWLICRYFSSSPLRVTGTGIQDILCYTVVTRLPVDIFQERHSKCKQVPRFPWREAEPRKRRRTRRVQATSIRTFPSARGACYVLFDVSPTWLDITISVSEKNIAFAESHECPRDDIPMISSRPVTRLPGTLWRGIIEKLKDENPNSIFP